jgi:ribose transport system ATP-binding protein
VKYHSLNQYIRYLSGGNQQKVILSRWLLGNNKILLFDEPTKGVDVGARGEFYSLLERLKEQGKSIILFTSDHREVHQISDDIYLLKKGRLLKIDDPDESTPATLLEELTKEGFERYDNNENYR